jgi:hypothetical protein
MAGSDGVTILIRYNMSELMKIQHEYTLILTVCGVLSYHIESTG